MGDGRGDWQTADCSSAGLLPPAGAHPETVIRVFGVRTVRWRGIFAVHTWIVVKEKDAPSYSRYDYTGAGRADPDERLRAPTVVGSARRRRQSSPSTECEPIVLAALNGIMWQSGMPRLHNVNGFSAGFILGVLGTYLAAWLYGYRRVV